MVSIREILVKVGRWLMLRERGSIRQSILGNGNVIKAENVDFNNVKLDIIDDNNQIIIGKGGVFTNVHFWLSRSGHRIEFGENCRISHEALLWFEDEKGLLQVGSNTTMVNVHIAVTESGSNVIIGEDCMFANDIDIRTGDSHSIIDPAIGKRLNHAADVVIGNHVWIAPHVVILKDVQIGENSVVATGAVVTKSGGSGVILGGNPAVVIKNDISWKRERISNKAQITRRE